MITPHQPIKSSFGKISNLIKPKSPTHWETQKRLPRDIQYNLDLQEFKQTFQDYREHLRNKENCSSRIMIVRKVKGGYRMVGQGREVAGDIGEVKKEAKKLGYSHVKFLQNVIAV